MAAFWHTFADDVNERGHQVQVVVLYPEPHIV